MRSKDKGVEPARFEAVRRRFELWRRTRQGRARIPERLWTSAVKLAATYGLCRTARTLGLDYNALKQRVESADNARLLGDRRQGGAAVERPVDRVESGQQIFAQGGNKTGEPWVVLRTRE